MKKILLVESSPRKKNSITTSTAMNLIQCIEKCEKVEVDTIDLWDTKIPSMDNTMLDAKYAIFSGLELTEEQNKNWSTLNEHINRFDQADLVIITAPTWNWGIPYVLKHYVDVLTQPGLTFSWTPDDGYMPLLKKRDAIIISSSGGDYTPGSGNEHEDYAIKYLKLWLTSCMGCDIQMMINMTMTAAGEEAMKQAENDANQKIIDFCKSL